LKSIPTKSCTAIAGRVAAALAALGLAASTRSAPAHAHAFGARYDLPLPLDFYLAGAGAAVALSFAIMALVFRSPARAARTQGIDLLRWRPLGVLLRPAMLTVLRSASVGLFFLILAAGFFGNQETLENFAPAFVWVIWWVGLAYVAALVGNVWPAINPWSIVFAAMEQASRRLALRDRLDLGVAYPAWLGVWPAVVLFGLFAWFELIVEASKQPAVLATAIAVYSGITWLGMAVFGRAAWLAQGEAFSLAFSVFGRFAPVGQPERRRGEDSADRWYLRPYASGLVTEQPCRPSMMAFVLLMLSTVAVDGFLETPLHASLLEAIASEPLVRPALLRLHDLDLDFIAAVDTVLLVLSPGLFFLVYLSFSWLAKEMPDSELPVMKVAGLFVLSLVPIAIAYHLAHYLSYLLIAGQLIIPLASDPFGFGWNLFGTADDAIDIGIVGAKFVWYAAVIAIVVGHVFAVGVAHFVALRAFGSPGAAIKSQYPFLVLMVGYTMLSLWILSQPIVGGPNLASSREPSGTLALAPYEFHEMCFELKPEDEVAFEFQAHLPVAFDIHYHDGLSIRYPVRLSGLSAHSGRFVADFARSYCLFWLNRNFTETSLTYRVSGP